MLAAWHRPFFRVGHRVNQREIVDEIRMRGVVLVGGRLAFFHDDFWKGCESFAEIAPFG